ncbi:MAG: NAD-dependent deacylase [Chloroflexi bacterium]|nr:NAD-dependent deacylase [Chloroflexota bacterium]
MQQLENVSKAARLMVESSYVVALIGAGMSVESGIPPFRGPGGLWTRIGEPDMNGFQQFLRDPKVWWDQMARQQQDKDRSQFREAIEKAKPNPGHYALAEMEKMGVLRHIITQNIDNLHHVAGSSNIAEIHGNRTKLRCLKCNLRFPRDEFFVEEIPPLCPQCGGLIKSDTVMFGEPIPLDVLEVCFDQTNLCDCMLVIGTSNMVYPAAGFPTEAKARGGYLIEVNLYETPLTDECDVVLRGPSGEILPRVVEAVRGLKGRV